MICLNLNQIPSFEAEEKIYKLLPRDHREQNHKSIIITSPKFRRKTLDKDIRELRVKRLII